VPAAQLASSLSLFLAVFAVVSFYLAIASLRTDLVLAVILWLIVVGLVLLSVGAGARLGNVTKAGGWVVLVFAVLAWYHAAGDVIAATFGHKVLPVGPPPIR
jgi:succinate-acetate transporter protein